MREGMEVLGNISHDGSFIRSNVTDIFNVKKGLVSVMSLGTLPQSRSFLLLRMQVQNFDDDYVVVMYCTVINLDGIDRLERSYG